MQQVFLQKLTGNTSGGGWENFEKLGCLILQLINQEKSET
jgi:hypothetical protein